MYRWVEHTAELELAIEGGSERELLADALAALGELLEPDRPSVAAEPSREQRRRVDVTAGDRAALLAAWLEELVFLAESDGFIAKGLVELELTPGELRSTVTGRIDAPRLVVKAVTYHRLTFEPVGDGFVATVVLDV